MEKKKINISGEMSVEDMIYVRETYGMDGLDDLLIKRAKYKLLGEEQDEWNYNERIS